MNGLSAAGLADLAGVTEAEVRRLVDYGILVVRGGAGPFLETDAPKVRLAIACERAGLPMAGIAAAIRGGSAVVFVSDTGVPLELLGSFLEAIGFARMPADELIREDELAVVPLL